MSGMFQRELFGQHGLAEQQLGLCRGVPGPPAALCAHDVPLGGLHPDHCGARPHQHRHRRHDRHHLQGRTRHRYPSPPPPSLNLLPFLFPTLPAIHSILLLAHRCNKYCSLCRQIDRLSATFFEVVAFYEENRTCNSFSAKEIYFPGSDTKFLQDNPTLLQVINSLSARVFLSLPLRNVEFVMLRNCSKALIVQ